jgi:hypothetical protein
MRPRKQIVKSNAERQREWYLRKKLGLQPGCKVNVYSPGTARDITPAIRGKLISQGVGLLADTNQLFSQKREYVDSRLFMNQPGMPAEQRFDQVVVKDKDFRYGDLWGHWSTVKLDARLYFFAWCLKTYSRFEHEAPAKPAWFWPHPKFKRQPMASVELPYHGRYMGCRNRRLLWLLRYYGIECRDLSARKPQKKEPPDYEWWEPKEYEPTYRELERVAANQTLLSGRKSAHIADDESAVAMAESMIDYEGMREAPSDNAGPSCEIGVSNRVSLNWTPGEPPQLVTPKQIAKAKAGFEMEAQRLRFRAPKKLKRKDKRRGPYIAERESDCGPFPPPRRRASIAPKEVRLAA